MTHGPDIIDLLTDTSSLDLEASQPASPAAAVAATPYARRDQLVQPRRPPQQPAADVPSPDTPDLPSPSVLFHIDNISATPTRRSESSHSSLQLISRNTALDIPSSPPTVDEYVMDELRDNQPQDYDEQGLSDFPGLPPPLDLGEFTPGELAADGELSDTSFFLDEIVRGASAFDRQRVASSDEIRTETRSPSQVGVPRMHADDPSDSAPPTEILDSESESDTGDAYFTRIRQSLRQAAEGNVRTGAALLGRRSASMQHTVADITGKAPSTMSGGSQAMPNSSPVLSLHRPPAIHSSQILATSTSLSLPSSPRPPADRSPSGMHTMSQALTLKEIERERRRMEREEKKRLREEEKARREKEKQYEKSLSKANRKQVDTSEIAKDIIVLADKSVLDMLAAPHKKSGMAHGASPAEGGLATGSDGGTSEGNVDEREHALFAGLIEAGIKYRVSDIGALGAFKWEMQMHRKWDSLMGMYVPLAVPRTVPVRLAAMVVWPSERLVDLVSRSQLADAVEVERGLLGVRRLFVVVVGLAKFLNKAQTVESREFARMIRQRLKSGSVHPAQSRRHTDTRTTVTEDEVDEAVLQIQVTNPLVTWFLQCKDTSALSRLLHQTSADMAQAVFRSKGQNEWISTDSSDPVMGSTFFTSSQLSMASNFITSEVRSALRAAVIRTGADLTDSWIRALATIPKVTLAVAQCIVAQYPTPRCLFDAWERQGSVPERAQMLANLTVSSGRRLGITMSTRIFHMFTESNPSKPYAEC